MMQARAHPRREKGIERGERPARELATELRQLSHGPGRGRPRAPSPRLGPATPGQGWAWPCVLSRVPPTSARAPPGAGVGPKRRAVARPAARPR